MSTEVSYERNLYVFIAICVTAVMCALQILNLARASFYYFNLDYIFQALFFAGFLAWNLLILKNQDFFESGDLKKKCFPWLIATGALLVRGVLGFILPTTTLLPMGGTTYISLAVFSAVMWYVFLNIAYVRPYKVAGSLPIHMSQQPGSNSPFKA